MNEEKWVSIDAIAEHLGISVSWVRKAVRLGRIPAKRCGRVLRFKISQVDQAIESQTDEYL